MVPRARMSSRRPFLSKLAVARVVDWILDCQLKAAKYAKYSGTGSASIQYYRLRSSTLGNADEDGSHPLAKSSTRILKRNHAGDGAGPLPLTSRAQQGQLVESYDRSGASIALAATRACCMHSK